MTHKIRKIAGQLRSHEESEKVSRAELNQWIEKAADLIKQKPEKAAKVLSSWINQPAGTGKKPASKKKAG